MSIREAYFNLPTECAPSRKYRFPRKFTRKQLYIIKKLLLYYAANMKRITFFFQMLSDAHFVEGIIRAAKLHAQVCPETVYFYRMDLDDELNYYKKKGPQLDLPGRI